MPTHAVTHEDSSGETTSWLEELIPIAVVIAAGCEPCAVRMVDRALERGAPADQVMRTLRILAQVCSTDCFARAVGAEVVARMRTPLAAGSKALRSPSPHPGGSPID